MRPMSILSMTLFPLPDGPITVRVSPLLPPAVPARSPTPRRIARRGRFTTAIARRPSPRLGGHSQPRIGGLGERSRRLGGNEPHLGAASALPGVALERAD